MGECDSQYPEVTSQRNDALADSEGCSLCPVGRGGLVEDAGDVVDNGLLADVKGLGNLSITFPDGDELDHVDLSWRETTRGIGGASAIGRGGSGDFRSVFLRAQHLPHFIFQITRFASLDGGR